MKNIYRAVGIALISMTTLLTACDSLDQAPEDFFASGNFWKDKEQTAGYMIGLHSLLRSSYSLHFEMGEVRGGLLGDGAGTGASLFGETLNSQPVIKQDLRKDNAYFNNWAGIYNYILQVNLALQELERANFLSEQQKKLYLAQAYGMRAYYYFFLYRTWGSVPLIKDVTVLNGKISAEKLSKKRAKASEIMAFLKEDINTSEKLFHAYGSDAFKDQYTWSEYATLMLKANIYAWAANVATDDCQATGKADLMTAKEALQKIINSGKFKLMPEFYQAFRTDFKQKNTENILAVSYNTTDKKYMPYIELCCAQKNFFTAAYDENNNQLSLDNKDEFGTNTFVDGLIRYQYKESFWKAFDKKDSRRDATFFVVKGSKEKKLTGSNFGLLLKKFSGHYDAAEGAHYFDCDGPIFRYAETLLLMAEIENNLANDPSCYINQIRKRAYGESYPVYTKQNQYENTKAILAEADKEFVFEGKRWFNLLRMKDAQGSSLVFDVSVNYPFIPNQKEGAILSTNEAYKTLWPISVGTMTNDPAIEQTPGYK